MTVSDGELGEGSVRAYDDRLARRLVATLRPYRTQVAGAVVVTLRRRPSSSPIRG